MKQISGMFIFLALLFAGSLVFGETSLLNGQRERESYATGVNIVRQLMQQGGEINLNLVIKGMQDGLTGQNMLLSEADLRQITTALHQRPQDRQPQATNTVDEVMPASVAGQGASAGLADPEAPASRPVDRPDTGAVLAAGTSTGAVGGAGAGQSWLPQTGSAWSQQQLAAAGPRSPEGALLSKRNQAMIAVSQMKMQRMSAAAQ